MQSSDRTGDTIRVVLVDDHAVVRQGVRTFLGTQPDLQVVGEAGSGEEGVRLCREHTPDVVLVDLVMPGLDGVETTRRIRQASPGTQVLILTSYHDDEHILPAMRAGARSYLLKDVSPEELAQAIRRWRPAAAPAIHRRGAPGAASQNRSRAPKPGGGSQRRELKSCESSPRPQQRRDRAPPLHQRRR